MNVLLTSAGRRVELLRAFQHELNARWASSHVFTVDASPHAPTLSLSDRAFVVPACTDPDYVPALLKLVRRHQIRVLVPLIDTELLVIAENRGAFRALGCEAVVSDPGAVQIARDKDRTARYLRRLGFSAPRVFTREELDDPERLPFPVFVKPIDGSGSLGAVRVDNAEELKVFLAQVRRPCVQSFETGEEFTIDVFAGLDGHARCAVPRRRWEVRAGEVSKCSTVKTPLLIDEAKRLVSDWDGCRGCITLQCFLKPSGKIVFFDVNLRFGGGFPLTYQAGANFPRWILDSCEGRNVPDFDEWLDGLVMLRFDDAVYFQSTELTQMAPGMSSWSDRTNSARWNQDDGLDAPRGTERFGH